MDVNLMGDVYAKICALLPWYPAVRTGRWLLGMTEFVPADLAVVCFWAVLVHGAALFLKRQK